MIVYNYYLSVLGDYCHSVFPVLSTIFFNNDFKLFFSQDSNFDEDAPIKKAVRRKRKLKKVSTEKKSTSKKRKIVIEEDEDEDEEDDEDVPDEDDLDDGVDVDVADQVSYYIKKI